MPLPGSLDQGEMRIERATRISGWENECATGDCVAGDVWRRILGCDEHRLNQSMAVLGLLAGEFRDCIVTPEVAIATWKRPPLRRRASTTKVLAAGYGFVSTGGANLTLGNAPTYAVGLKISGLRHWRGRCGVGGGPFHLARRLERVGEFTPIGHGASEDQSSASGSGPSLESSPILRGSFSIALACDRSNAAARRWSRPPYGSVGSRKALRSATSSRLSDATSRAVAASSRWSASTRILPVSNRRVPGHSRAPVLELWQDRVPIDARRSPCCV